MPGLAHAAKPTPVRDTAADEFVGFAGTGFLGWTQNSLGRPNHYDLFLRNPSGIRLRVNRPGTQGFGGGIDGATVVYEEVAGRIARVVLYDTGGGGYTELPIAGRNGSGSHPTISGEWILYTSGRRDRTTSVRLYNRLTGERRQLARIAARGRRRFVYSGQVAGDWAVWGRVIPGRQDVFLTNVSTRTTVRIPPERGERYHYNPAVTKAGTVFFVDGGASATVLARLVELRQGHRPRALVTLRRDQNAGYMYAAQEGLRLRLLYGLFKQLPHNLVTYTDIFAITLTP
jgi:hypothetical protein